MQQFARVSRALYDADWMRYGWPVEVGGLGGPAMLRAIVGEEVVGRRLAEPGPYSMLEVLAPTMIDYAPAELAAEMVPRLLSGHEQWCQGFSEPGSGSDLASLTTRAAQDGDNWIVNGQKVWTSFAQFSTRCVLLTRTAPGHDGITAFFVDLDTPGITIRPLRTMHGVDEFCEVYYDDVVIPSSRMLGRPGDGWRLAMDLLPYERSSCFWQRIAYLYARFDELIAQTSASAEVDEFDFGAAYLALHTLRCRSRATQHRLRDGAPTRPGHLHRQGAAGQRRAKALRHRARPAARDAGARRHTVAFGVPVLPRGDHLRRHRRDSAQHHRAPAAGPREGVSVDTESLQLLRRRLCATTMTAASGQQARRCAGRSRLARHARRNARCRNSFGVPAARRDRRARARAQRRRAARRRARGRRYRTAAVRGRLLGGLGAHRPVRARRSTATADTPCARG